MARKRSIKSQPLTEVLNPFDSGVSYADFLKSLPDGKTASEVLKNKCTPEQLEWLEIELKNYKNK